MKVLWSYECRYECQQNKG